MSLFFGDLMKQKVNTILFSPHSDDIAYSLGGAVALNYFKNPLMITVFTRSAFSPRIKLTSEEEISDLRKREDDLFSKKTGLLLDTLPFPEPPLRGLKTDNEIFTANVERDQIFDSVHRAIYKKIECFPDAVVLSPLALGNHIDHQIVFKSCVKACNILGNKLSFYEDVPYVSKLKLKQIEDYVDDMDDNLSPTKINITSVFDEKIENLHLYGTQIGKRIPDGVHSHSKRLAYSEYASDVLDKAWSYSMIQYLYSFYSRLNRSKMYERIWQKV